MTEETKPPMAPDVAGLDFALGAMLDAFMTKREAEGGSFVDTAIDVSAVLGDYLARVFSAIEHDPARAAITGLFIKHLPPAVESMHRKALMALADQQGRQ